MSTKMQKIVAAITATALAASVVLGGTLAWQSINQEATNIVSGTINPGGRLHDDFDGNNRNKDIYVENFADQEIYARIQLREYLEIGTTEPGTTTDSLVIPAAAEGYSNAATAGNVDTWAIHYFDSTKNETNQYVDFSWGGMTTYLPTFNMNKDSLLPDINGTYEGLYTDGSEPAGTSIEDDRYADYIDYADAQYAGGVDGFEVWDADLDDEDEVGEDVDALIDVANVHTTFAAAVAPVLTAGTDYATSYTEVIKDQAAKATHIPTTTRDATVISMADWKAMSDTDKDTFYGWVYDVDGWAYWSQPIEPKTVDASGNVTSKNTTGLLLDAINPRIDDNYYYQIHVIAQFITANDLGQTDGTGFFAGTKGSNPSADALALLNSIGVNITGGSTLNVTASAASVAPGGTVTLSAADTSGNSVTGATWIINGSNVASTRSTTPATETAIDPDTGVLSVAATEQASKLTVIAIKEQETTDPDTKVTTKSTLIGSYDINVSSAATTPVDTYDIEITGADEIYAGGTIDFEATVNKNNNAVTGAAVTWSLENGTGTTNIDSTSGRLTVDAAETVGNTLTVTATYTYDTDKTVTKTHDVTVKATVYTVDITTEPKAQAADGVTTQTFAATVSKNGSVDNALAVTWSVDSTDASTSINPTSGVLTIAKTEPKDKLIVTATYNGETDTVEVPVTHTYAVAVAADGGATTVSNGESLQYTATVTRNGETDTSSGVEWSVTPATTGVSISTSGLLEVASTVTNSATLTVTATSKADDTKSDSATVTVTVLTAAQKVSAAKEGTKVKIDGVEWWVVVQDEAQDRALLWAAAPVKVASGEIMTFDTDSAAWSGSDMQNYLNKTYKNTLTTLKDIILPTQITTAALYTRSGGYDTTTDSVFLLSEADLFGSYHDGTGEVSASTIANEFTYVDPNATTYTAIVTEDMIKWSTDATQYAWLRSPYGEDDHVARIDHLGNVYSNGCSYLNSVRPAMWVNLAS